MASNEHFQFLEKEKKEKEVVDTAKLKYDAIINSEKHLRRISDNVAFFFWLIVLASIFYFLYSLYAGLV